MGRQLDRDELQLAIDAIEFAEGRSAISVDQKAKCESAKGKLRAGLVLQQDVARSADAAEPERFPSQEEAKQYSDIGQQLMVAAASRRVNEATHHKLSCLMVGLTTALARLMQVDRQRFCNTLVTNVMFTTLKAAHLLPSASQELADGSQPE